MKSFFRHLKKFRKYNGSLSAWEITKRASVYREWKSQLNSGLSPLDLELPWITIDAKRYLESYIKKHIKKKQLRVFEYGTGGSSLFFLKHGCEVVSVEHDSEWFGRVKQRVLDRKLKKWTGFLEKPEPILGDMELDASNPAHYYTTDKNYINFIFKKYVNTIEKYPDMHFDIVLVDGRSRPACLAHARHKVTHGGLLVLDNSEREYYTEKFVLGNTCRLQLSRFSPLVASRAFTKTSIYSCMG